VVSQRILFLCEILLISALVLITRCANYRDVFNGGQIYFVDADCYARMARARICFEHPGAIVRHHEFENFPEGISPHTTAPLDYLIVAVAALFAPFTRSALDLAGAMISPLIALTLGIFLCWWTRRMALRFRFALIGLYAVSPILAHGTTLGRPDHQSLLIALIALALCAEWTCSQTPTRAWAIIGGISWGLALWVSLYEPLVLLALAIVVRFCTGPGLRGFPREKWIAFAVIVLLAAITERRFPSLLNGTSIAALENWSGDIGELARIPLNSRIWFEWCGWLLALAPILFWPRRAGRRAPRFLVALLAATFTLTMAQARWSYFFVLVFVFLTPEILAAVPHRAVALALFVVSLFPIAQTWDRRFSESELAARAERQLEQVELRRIASEIRGPFVAPWWLSPPLSYWSKEPGVAGSSHESIGGIIDCARFYGVTEPAEAFAICARHQVQWLVSYDSERLAGNSARLLHSSLTQNAMCYVLDRRPSQAPPFLRLIQQTARFKLYRVEK
jgi:hypothetical protein